MPTVLRTFYTRWLLYAELGILTGLTALVVVGALLIALSGWIDPRPLTELFGVEDLTVLQTLVYNATLILCLFGAVMAARRASHIAVDAVTPHLRPAVRARMEGAMWLVAAGVSLWIAMTGFEYVSQFVGEEERIILGQGGGYSKRLWRWPLVIAFGLMALHFAVTGSVRLMGKQLHEVGLADPPVVAEPAAEGSGETKTEAHYDTEAEAEEADSKEGDV